MRTSASSRQASGEWLMVTRCYQVMYGLRSLFQVRIKNRRALKWESLDFEPVLQDQALDGAEGHRRLPEYLNKTTKAKKQKPARTISSGTITNTHTNTPKWFQITTNDGKSKDCECALVKANIYYHILCKIYDHRVRNSPATEKGNLLLDQRGNKICKIKVPHNVHDPDSSTAYLHIFRSQCMNLPTSSSETVYPGWHGDTGNSFYHFFSHAIVMP